MTINKGTPHLKPQKNQNRRAALGRPAIKLLGGGGEVGGLQLVCGRLTLALGSALVHQTKQLQQKHHITKQEQTTKSNQNTQQLFYLFSIFYHKARRREKWAAMQVATMLADHKQIDERTTMRNQSRSAALGRPAIKLLGASTSLRSTSPRP